jgi:hypothetical protein
MTLALSLIAFAVLFALLGVLKPRGECGSGCAGCTGSCGAGRREHHDA